MEKVLKLTFSQKSSRSTRAPKISCQPIVCKLVPKRKKNLRVSCSSHLAKASLDQKTKQNKTHFVGRERARERHIVAHCCCYNGRKKDRFYQVGFWRLVITFFVCKSRFFCGKAWNSDCDCGTRSLVCCNRRRLLICIK